MLRLRVSPGYILSRVEVLPEMFRLPTGRLLELRIFYMLIFLQMRKFFLVIGLFFLSLRAGLLFGFDCMLYLSGKSLC